MQNAQSLPRPGLVHMMALCAGAVAVIGSSVVAPFLPIQAIGIVCTIAAIGMLVLTACQFGLLSRIRIPGHQLEYTSFLCFFASTVAQFRTSDELGIVSLLFAIGGAVLMFLSREEARNWKQLATNRTRG